MATTVIGNTPPLVNPQPSSAAAQMAPSRRKLLALEAMAGTQPLSALAGENDVSRKFVYAQIDKAERALDSAFAPEEEEDRVLFRIPVTKHWLQQVVLCAILDCHSSYP